LKKRWWALHLKIIIGGKADAEPKGVSTGTWLKP